MFSSALPLRSFCSGGASGTRQSSTDRWSSGPSSHSICNCCCWEIARTTTRGTCCAIVSRPVWRGRLWLSWASQSQPTRGVPQQLDRPLGLRSPDTRSGRGHSGRPTHHPMTPTYSPHQGELPLGLPPCRRRSRTRELRSLAAQLAKAIDLAATFETGEPAEWVTYELTLREALIQLSRQRGRALWPGRAAPESGPRT